MAEDLLNAIIDGSLSYEVITQGIKAGKLPKLDVDISGNETDVEVNVITDFVPHFINFVKSKLSSCLTPQQLASCSPKRPPPFKRGKYRHETKPAVRASLFVKNVDSDATPRSQNSSKDHSKSVDSYLSSRSKQHAGKQSKQQNTQSRKPRRIALTPNNESDFSKSWSDKGLGENKVNGGQQMELAQQGKKQEKRRITPTLLTPSTEPLQENENAKLLFETSSVLETSESSVDSDGSPSCATPFDKKMKKLERTMRGKRRNDSAKMPLSAFLTSDDKFEQGAESQITNIGTPVKPLTPNVHKSYTQRLVSSPICASSEMKTAKPTLSKLSLSLNAPQKDYELHFTEDSLPDKRRLNAFAEIYKCILLENLASNITVELYFLFSVLNCKLDKETQDLRDDVIFESKESCIYFSAKVLSGAKSLLAILDKRALRMISENKQLRVLAPELVDFIQEKLSEELNSSSASSMKSFNFSPSLGVPFQVENNRKAFLSDRYFYSFSKMRDKFYGFVRVWEENHMDNDWNIEVELGEQFQSFFHDYEEFPTYSQFSQLFVAQLIEMSSQDFSGMFSRDEGTSTSLLSYLKSSNPAKFQLLQERFFMPLILEGPCPKPSFTDVEKFFKVFIDRSSNFSFITHLKNTLLLRLLEINMVSWNVNMDESTDDENDHLSAARNDISTCLSEVRILAKLLGYIVFSPYVADSLSRKAPDDCYCKAVIIQPFKPTNILTEAVKNQRLILTVPWLVSYLSMMDRISLKSQVNREVFRSLAAIYRSQNLRLQHDDLSYDKLFILIQLGWLFEQPVIVEELPFYKMLPNNDLLNDMPLDIGTQLETQPIITKAMMIRFCPYLTEFRMVLTNVGVSSVRKITPLTHKEKMPIADTNNQLKDKMIEDFFKYKPKYFKESTDFVTERFCSNLKHDANTDKVPKLLKNAITSLEGSVEFNEGEKLEIDSLKQKNNALFVKQLSFAKGELTAEMKATCDEYCNKNSSDVVSKLLPADVDKRVAETAAKIVSHDVRNKLNGWIEHKLMEFFENELKTAYNRLLMNILKKNNKSFTAEH